MCSTPFGITEVGTGLRSLVSSLRSLVLNAFRHHRIGHARFQDTVRTFAPSAQRLSASQSGHTGRQSIQATTDMCSTPFGITEVGTACTPSSSFACHDVLNAFRHH